MMATYALSNSAEEAQAIEAVNCVNKALNSINDHTVSPTQNAEPPSVSQSKFLPENLNSILEDEPSRTDPVYMKPKVFTKCECELNFEDNKTDALSEKLTDTGYPRRLKRSNHSQPV